MFWNKKNSQKLDLSAILDSLRPGRVQSAGYLQVVPLLADAAMKYNITTPDAILVSTCEYGTIVFDNTSSELLIVPLHVGYIVEQEAQNHAMAHVAVVKPKTEEAFDTAMCIQQNQGGFIQADNYKMITLPFSLREKALNMRNEKSFDRLWNDIGSFNQQFDAKPNGHLENFLNSFKTELDQFVAEFECVPLQVGAIILLDGEIVGVERAPSEAYWNAVWPGLIRECYGSLAIEYMKSKNGNVEIPKGRVLIKEKTDSLDDLEGALLAAEDKQNEIVQAKIKSIETECFEPEEEERTGLVTIETIENKQFVGQYISANNKHYNNSILYASLIMKDAFRQLKFSNT